MIAVDLPPGIALVPFAPWHLAAINPREPEAAALRPSERLAYGRTVASGFQCQTALKDHLLPIACWGVVEYPARCLTGFLALDVAADRYPVALWRISRKFFTDALSRPECHRVEFTLPPSHVRSIRWLERLGFECEGTLRRRGYHGEDVLMYALVKP